MSEAEEGIDGDDEGRRIALRWREDAECPWRVVARVAMTVPTARRGSCCISGSLARRQEQLEAAQDVALGGVEEPEGADAVHAAWRHVLQEAAQHLVGWEGEDLVPVIARVAVAEGDGVVVHREQRPVGHRGAVDVAAEILEDLVGAVGDGLGEDGPALLPTSRCT